jgi:hypothetical protein
MGLSSCGRCEHTPPNGSVGRNHAGPGPAETKSARRAIAHAPLFPRPVSPGLFEISSPSLRREGAGKAGRWPRPWPACDKKSRRQSPQVWPDTSGLPCAMVWRLIRALPGDRLDCPRVATTRCARYAGHQHRGARTTRFHRRIKVVRRHDDHAATRYAHRIPHPTFVTTREAPPRWDGMRGSDHIFRKNETRIFSRRGGWTGRLALKAQAKLAVGCRCVVQVLRETW